MAADFRVDVPLGRVWKDDAGEMWFEGVASSTSIDKTNERMTEKAVAKMATCAGIDLLPSHTAGPMDELGTITEAQVDNEKLRVCGKLDADNPEAIRFFRKCVAGKAYQLSVGGRVKQAHWAFDDDAKKSIKHIDDVELDHVALCRPGRAANPDTYLAVMAKSAESLLGGETMADEVNLTEDAKKGLLAGIADLFKGRLGKADENNSTEPPITEQTSPAAEAENPTETVAPTTEQTTPQMGTVEVKPNYATSEEVAELRDAVNALGEGLQAFLGTATAESEEKPVEAEAAVAAAKSDDAPADMTQSIKRSLAEKILALEKTDEEKVALARLACEQVDELAKSVDALEAAFVAHNRTEHKGKPASLETPGEPLAKSDDEKKNDLWRNVF